MRVYLAGPSCELPRVKRWAAALDGEGIEITHRWWEAVEANGVGTDGMLTTDEQVSYAHGDLGGIERAHYVWVLWPEERGRSLGTAVELGYALGRCPTIATGTHVRASIFTALAKMRSPVDEDGFTRLCAHKRWMEADRAG